MEEVEKIIFEARAHEKGWEALGNVVISDPNLTPVGRSHNGFEETLFRHVQDKSKVRLVCEIGSELGGSTRFLLEQMPYTSCVCIDPWPDGYKLPKEFFDSSPGLENQKASVLQLFLYFCRAYRSRILPIRAFSVEGIIWLNEMGLVPDIFYVDGDHRYIGVLNDLILIHHLFPSALIIGDDWNFSSNYPVYKGIERSV